MWLRLATPPKKLEVLWVAIRSENLLKLDFDSLIKNDVFDEGLSVQNKQNHINLVSELHHFILFSNQKVSLPEVEILLLFEFMYVYSI